MKAPNITPGPWAVGNTDPLLFGRKQGNGTEPIGFVYGPSFPERSDVGQIALSNAQAIAAVPDLIGALIELVSIEANHSHFGGEMYQDRIDKAWEKAQASLLKAGCTE